MVLQLREAKNDQFSRGQVRTHHLTGSPICPVLSLRDHARFNPHWIREPASPVFACKGKGITREDISALLRVCSIALGYPPELVGSHSLRKGGATALFAATGNMELVKRFGGWKSDAVHAYLYSDLHGGEQHGTHMLRSKPALQPQQRSRSTPARVNHSQASDCRAGCIDSDAPSMHVASPIVCSLDVTSRSRSPFCHWCIIALGLSIGAPPFPFTFIAGPVMAAEPPAPWTDRSIKKKKNKKGITRGISWGFPPVRTWPISYAPSDACPSATTRTSSSTRRRMNRPNRPGSTSSSRNPGTS